MPLREALRIVMEEAWKIRFARHKKIIELLRAGLEA